MDNVTLNFTANHQSLTGSYPFKMSSNTVSYVIAVFNLGDGWNPEEYDAICAAWKTDFFKIMTILDVNGTCIVPHEVLSKRANVYVNLVGYKSIDGELKERLTTYPLKAITVDAMSIVEGTETADPTPSMFEQYIAEVGTYARNAHTDSLNAEGYANDAQNSADSASASATYAETKANEASASATIAETKANEASASAISAAESAASAEASVEAGGYITCEGIDEHLIIKIHNLETISFINDDERLVVVYG